MRHILSGVIIECIQGDIASCKGFDAVVNAANAQLMPGGGVAGAIHRAAGEGLYKECRHLAPIRPGEAVITGGHNLPNKYCIHCLGPVYGVDKPKDKLLADCYKNALKLAESYKIASIVFPSISTGAFGYPMQEAAEIAFNTIINLISSLRFIRKIRFVLYSRQALEIHEQVLSKLIPTD